MVADRLLSLIVPATKAAAACCGPDGICCYNQTVSCPGGQRIRQCCYRASSGNCTLTCGAWSGCFN
jgi:hypothetical protein